MKTLRTVALAITFVLATATASLAGHSRNAGPTWSADHNTRVSTLKTNIIEDGYTLQGVQEQPIYYFAIPQGNYVWGTVVYTYTRTGTVSTETIEVSVQVKALQQGGYTFPEITVREHGDNE